MTARQLAAEIKRLQELLDNHPLPRRIEVLELELLKR
jgi:hypothetical protein